MGERAREQYGVVGTPDSSVYAEVFRQLMSDPLARFRRRGPKAADAGVFDLLLCQLNKDAPYKRLKRYRGRRQVVNFFRGIHKLVLKSMMARLLRNATPALTAALPLTFVIMPGQTDGDERQALLAESAARAADGRPDVWIAKSSHGAKGDDIHIGRGAAAVLERVDAQSDTRAWVVQKYVEDPLLYRGRKFDIRCWVLVDADFNIFMYRTGVLRLTSTPYTPERLDDAFVHLTNHCIQETHADFGKHGEETNELFFDDFAAYVHAEHQVDFWTAVVPRLHTVIFDAIHCAHEQIAVLDSSPYRSFQLLGFDFMLTTAFDVVLLEINGSPAAAAELLPDLARDLIRRAIDPLFPPLAPTADDDDAFAAARADQDSNNFLPVRS